MMTQLARRRPLNERKNGSPNFMQVNLNHTSSAQDLLLQTMAEEGVDVALVSEPYRIPKHPLWMGDENGQAAITWRATRGRPVLKRAGSGPGFVAAGWGSLGLISCYFSPNRELSLFERFLEDLGSYIGSCGQRSIIVVGDLNAKSTAWGSTVTDPRGRLLRDWMVFMGLEILNVGQTSTCVRWQGETVVDVTMTSPAVARMVMRWRVADQFTYSEHRYIKFELPHPGVVLERINSNPSRGWVVRKLDCDLFDAAMLIST